MQIDAVFDIETEDWTTFVVGGLYDGSKFRYSVNENEFFDWLLEINGTIWAHNAGHFDSLWFYQMLQKARKPPKRVALQGSRLLRLSVDNLTIQDSFSLIPMSLRKAAGIVEDYKGDFDYRLISRDMPYHLYLELIEYLQRDCVVTWKVLQFVKRYCRENGLVIKGTVGATAWHSAKKQLRIKPENWNTSDWKFARAGYYGGRAEVFRTTSESGERFDRNSSYPAALVNTALPLGKRAMVGPTKAGFAFNRYDGIYSATVFCPDMLYPPLPVRIKDFKGQQRLIFPVGRFAGHWTRLELQYAMNQGVQLLRLNSAVVWNKSEKILAPWCQRLWDLRHNTDNKGLARWLKWVLNSLTGKLGEKAEKSVCVFPTAGADIVTCDGHTHPHDENTKCPSNLCCPHRCVGACKKWSPVDPFFNLWSKPIWFLPKNSYPHWAAYLTSEARISLHRQLINSQEKATYCDTDSVYTESGHSIKDIGDELGQWKYEGAYKQWHALAPKLYCYDNGEDYIIKGKGFPGLDIHGFETLARGEKIDIAPGPNTFKVGAKKGEVFSKKTGQKQTRLVPGLCGARKVLGNKTYPMTIKEFLNHLVEHHKETLKGKGKKK